VTFDDVLLIVYRERTQKTIKDGLHEGILTDFSCEVTKLRHKKQVNKSLVLYETSTGNMIRAFYDISASNSSKQERPYKPLRSYS
jgi:hypothetical protein